MKFQTHAITRSAGESNRSLRITLIAGEYPPSRGGVAGYVASLARGLVARGHKVSVITSASWKPPHGSLHHPSVEVSPVIPSYDCAGQGALVDALRTSRPDVVCLQYVPSPFGPHGIAPQLALVPLAVSKATGAKVVTMFHETAYEWRDWRPKPGWWIGALAHRFQLWAIATTSDTLITSNPKFEQRLIRATKGRKNVHVIPVGTNVFPFPSPSHALNQLRAIWRLGDGAVIGELAPSGSSKDPNRILRVLARLPKDSHALLIGNVRVEHDLSLRRLSEALGLAGRWHVTGYLPPERASQALQALDVYLHTPAYGVSGRSTTIAAAMAHGLPIVGFSGDHMNSYFTPATAMLATKGEDVAYICRAGELVRDVERQQQLRIGVQSAYDHNVAWDIITRRFENALSSFLPH